jgi:hypothetical protein
MMKSGLVLAAAISLAACEGRDDDGDATRLTAERRVAIADSIRAMVVSTYDLRKPDAVRRLMSLYPDSGPVYSANSGRVSTTRRELEQQIETFWRYVGSNMRDPQWEWTSMQIDVLGPDAAVITASYRIPHLTPRDLPHVIAGAWTAAFAKRGGRWVVVQEHLSDLPQAEEADSVDHTQH